MKKNGKLSVIYLVIFIAYNLFTFIIFSGYNSVFWTSYLFMVIAYAIHIACVYFVLKDVDAQAMFFGIPLISFSVFFVVAEFFCSFVFMLFREIASIKIAILIQALLLCLFIVVAIISIMTRDVVSNVDKTIKTKVNFIKGITIDIEMLMHRSTNLECTTVLKRLSEVVKYSDPMSNEFVAIQEQMIMQSLMELRSAFDMQNTMEVQNICNKIELLFIERNKKLMISK